MIIKKIGFLALCMCFITINAQERTNPNDQPVELGKVSWYRDYDEAQALAKSQNKKILVFFQEVPGCSTSTGYGNDVLRHPLMIEAIEDEFIPVVVYNNQSGKDKITLEKFKEPSWNNPVVRIVDTNGKDVVKRVANDYTAIGLYNAMQVALKVSKKSIPEYMNLLGTELAGADKGSAKNAYFKMYCFWTGEKHLGTAEGILATEPGFMSGHEVVKVTYDERITNAKELAEHAKAASITPITEDRSYRIAENDQKYTLKHTNYKYLPLTGLQQTKINSALANRQNAEKYLSPKQLLWLRQLNAKNAKNKVVLYNKDFNDAWVMKSTK